MQTKTVTAGVVLALTVFFCLPITAQESRIQATIRGGMSAGKCTFELDVDQAAEVEIHGSRGDLKTISGNPARWRRLNCTQALPPSPSNFKFLSVRGRGKQELVKDPNSNQGVAVIRMDDEPQGRGRYVGTITWQPNGGRCIDTLGQAEAKKLVEQCLQVSPATHPPCNAVNACDLITDEIKRGCKLIGQGAPSFCTTYK